MPTILMNNSVDKNKVAERGMCFEIDGAVHMLFRNMDGELKFYSLEDADIYSERDISGKLISEIERDEDARFIEVKSLTIN